MSKTEKSGEEFPDLSNGEIIAAETHDDLATSKHGDVEEVQHGNYKRSITPRQIHVRHSLHPLSTHCLSLLTGY